MSASETNRLKDVARRGDEIYERLRARLEVESRGMFVAIDVDSGDHAVGETALAAANELRIRRPSAEAWLARIGSRTIHRIGRVPLRIGARRPAGAGQQPARGYSQRTDDSLRDGERFSVRSGYSQQIWPKALALPMQWWQEEN